MKATAARRPCGRRPAAPAIGLDGRTLQTPAEVVAELEERFQRDFGAGGVLVGGGAACGAAFADLPPMESPISHAEWTARLLETAIRTKRGRAPGPDGLPPEFFRLGGSRYCGVLASIAEKSFGTGVPLAWRGGRMAQVPNGPKTRGVLCSPCGGKL